MIDVIKSVNCILQIAELKMTRELASQITAKGAVLYELLGKEVKLRVSIEFRMY